MSDEPNEAPDTAGGVAPPGSGQNPVPDRLLTAHDRAAGRSATARHRAAPAPLRSPYNAPGVPHVRPANQRAAS